MARSDTDVEAQFDVAQLASALDSFDGALLWSPTTAACSRRCVSTRGGTSGREISRPSTHIGAARRPAEVELTCMKDTVTAAEYRSALPMGGSFTCGCPHARYPRFWATGNLVAHQPVIPETRNPFRYLSEGVLFVGLTGFEPATT